MGSYTAVTLALFGALVGMVTMRPQGVDTANLLKLQPRIIGGFGVFNRCRAPYNSVVALRFEVDFNPIIFCAGVMITDRIVLTAARCLLEPLGGDLTTMKVVVGERDLYMTDRDEQRLDILSLKIHPGYNPDTNDNNVALVQLSQPAQLSSCVQPALSMEDDPTACTDIDRSCLMAGWGPYAENETPTNSRLLRYAPVTVYGDVVTSIISLRQGNSRPIGSVYAEGINPNHKACFLDWGDIVICMRNGRYVLRGIISDHNCNAGGALPIVVMDVPAYQSWIDTCTANWDACPAL